MSTLKVTSTKPGRIKMYIGPKIRKTLVTEKKLFKVFGQNIDTPQFSILFGLDFYVTRLFLDEKRPKPYIISYISIHSMVSFFTGTMEEMKLLSLTFLLSAITWQKLLYF